MTQELKPYIHASLKFSYLQAAMKSTRTAASKNNLQ